jgi:hypothetical protein
MNTDDNKSYIYTLGYSIPSPVPACLASQPQLGSEATVKVPSQRLRSFPVPSQLGPGRDWDGTQSQLGWDGIGISNPSFSTSPAASAGNKYLISNPNRYYKMVKKYVADYGYDSDKVNRLIEPEVTCQDRIINYHQITNNPYGSPSRE